MDNSPTSMINLAQEGPVVRIEAEPDVTWGPDGIDDWGWTAETPEPLDAQAGAAR